MDALLGVGEGAVRQSSKSCRVSSDAGGPEKARHLPGFGVGVGVGDGVEDDASDGALAFLWLLCGTRASEEDVVEMVMMAGVRITELRTPLELMSMSSL